MKYQVKRVRGAQAEMALRDLGLVKITESSARDLFNFGIPLVVAPSKVNSHHFFGGWHLAMRLDPQRYLEDENDSLAYIKKNYPPDLKEQALSSHISAFDSFPQQLQLLRRHRDWQRCLLRRSEVRGRHHQEGSAASQSPISGVLIVRIGAKDRHVIRCFIDRKPCHTGHKLDTDGQRLDGLWMGGSGIAVTDRTGQRHFPDLGSKAAQTVQRAVARMLFSKVDGKKRRKGRY